MNVGNIDKSIAVMERAKPHENNFSMVCYQAGPDISSTEYELHSCGNTACFAGTLAISPEWKESGGTVNSGGKPVIYPNYSNQLEDYVVGYFAISYWLDISENLARSLVYGDLYLSDSASANVKNSYSDFYEKIWKDVKPQDVIDKLILIKSGALE